MSTPRPQEDVADQQARTLLAWRRTALSLVVAGALVVHLASRSAEAVAEAVVLVGLAGVIAFAWLAPRRHAGAAGVSLVVGVGLLCGLALLSLLG